MTAIPGFPAYRGVGTRAEMFDYSSLTPGGSFVEAGDGTDFVFAGGGKHYLRPGRARRHCCRGW